MLDLTFGEQVKIILSRKGMTIKELAEMIEEHTGRKMSRQNLTQRLGRDNFQEQDMRMIASILECPFQLNILGEGRQNSQEEQEQNVTEAELLNLARKKAKKQVHPTERDITIGELVDMNQGMDALLEEKEELHLQDEVFFREPVPEETADLSENPEEPTQEIREETSALTVEEPVEEQPEEEPEQTQEEPMEDAADPAGQTEVEAEAVSEKETPQEPVQEKPVKKTRGSWRDFFQRRSKKENKASEEVRETGEPVVTEKTAAETDETYMEGAGTEGYGQEEPVQENVPDGTVNENEPEVSVEEEILQSMEESQEEDLEKGDVNPYTGHEYESNTVRMHPKRIGYVQVYDRSSHQWTDMTEWAFLGYQERKKALLGNDYEPPIYLD